MSPADCGRFRTRASSPDAKNASIRDLEARFTHAVGARVRVEHKGKGGRVVIAYANLDELDRIIAALRA